MNAIQEACLKLRKAYLRGQLGDQTMPEDTHPIFSSTEERLAYFTLPMSLNYQRNSYTLWRSSKIAFSDPETKAIFDVSKVSNFSEDRLRGLLTKHRVALQPRKHTNTWHRISNTISTKWGSIEKMLDASGRDFLALQESVQRQHKKGFPYLSGPKIFHYWCFILGEYGDVGLGNKDLIQIAPDTHIIKCSIRLGVLSEQESKSMARDDISRRWRDILRGTDLTPIDMHSPLWFWSKNNFKFKLESA